MKKKVFQISDALFAPFDEGKKKIALSLHNQLAARKDILFESVTNAENQTAELKVAKIALNKLFLSIKLRSFLRSYSPDIIIYIPYSSYTFFSFLRTKFLKLMAPEAKVIIVGSRYIKLNNIQANIIKNFLKPDLLLLMGKADKDFFLQMGLQVKILPPAVDTSRFSPAKDEEKAWIRSKYNIPHDKTVVLHVGHIKADRNIRCLLNIQKLDHAQVLIVGSTTTQVDDNLKASLLRQGVIVLDKFIPDVSEIYKMSDIYVFPVLNAGENVGAIEMPLSVTEAMACNLPVITTKFGGLMDYFEEDDGFRYFSTDEELIESIKCISGSDKAGIHNNRKVEALNWENLADEIIGS